MKKIISLFKRNYETDHLVRDEVVEGAEWVVKGEGIPTRKYDGMCCLIKDGKFYKRFDCKEGKTPPPGFFPVQDPDPVTKHWPGWVEVGLGKDDSRHREAFEKLPAFYVENGTFELIGPKVNGNPEKVAGHVLVRHGVDILSGVPKDFLGLRDYLRTADIEGIVWHHIDGRMVKIKKKDFGFKRG